MGIIRDQMSVVFDIDVKTINLYFDKTDKFYRKIEIPKRSGGKREIYLPNPEIKMFQHFISEKYLCKMEISKNATAYIKRKSILDNVEPHLGNSHFMFTDISDFFDNIDKKLMYIILQKKFNDLDKNEIEDIIKICTYQGRFVQGAVTSPMISNIYLVEFDKAINELIELIPNGRYTRYSDDMTISSSEKLHEEIIKLISDNLNKYNLKLNMKKTYFSSYIQEINITGLKIVDQRIGIGCNKKRELHNMIYHKLKKGSVSKETAKQILGHLYYLMHVDPHYFNVINLKYTRRKATLIDRLSNIVKTEELNILKMDKKKM